MGWAHRCAAAWIESRYRVRVVVAASVYSSQDSIKDVSTSTGLEEEPPQCPVCGEAFDKRGSHSALATRLVSELTVRLQLMLTPTRPLVADPTHQGRYALCPRPLHLQGTIWQ